MFRSRLTMLAILAALHLLVGASLIPALPLGVAGRVVAGLLLLASIVLVPLGFRARHMPRPVAWAGLLAMGVFSSLAVLSILRALVLALLTVLGVPLAPAWITGSALAVLAGVAAITLLGLFNARRTARVAEVRIALPGLPPELEGFSIVQLSDIHVSATIRRRYIEAMVRRANALRADVVAITGDLVDGSVEQLRWHIAPLGELRAAHGVYVVTGNHEYYADAEAWVAELRRLGLDVLMNEHRVIERRGARLVLAGITDYSAGIFVPAHRSDARAAARGAPAGAPRVLLAHQPRSAPAALEAGFDLQLSGHTHGGQFWPWMHFVRLQQPWVHGLQRLETLQVYISRGTGYWGPPIRFGAPSEITRIRLTAAQSMSPE
jgi:hypothetical protein